MNGSRPVVPDSVATHREAGDPRELAQTVTEHFRRRHGRAPDGVWCAPGRVNLIVAETLGDVCEKTEMKKGRSEKK